MNWLGGKAAIVFSWTILGSLFLLFIWLIHDAEPGMLLEGLVLSFLFTSGMLLAFQLVRWALQMLRGYLDQSFR